MPCRGVCVALQRLPVCLQSSACWLASRIHGRRPWRNCTAPFLRRSPGRNKEGPTGSLSTLAREGLGHRAPCLPLLNQLQVIIGDIRPICGADTAPFIWYAWKLVSILNLLTFANTPRPWCWGFRTSDWTPGHRTTNRSPVKDWRFLLQHGRVTHPGQRKLTSCNHDPSDHQTCL